MKLKDEADVGVAVLCETLGGKGEDVFSPEQDPPGSRPVKSAQQVHQCALPSSRRAGDCDHLPCLHRQAQTIENYDAGRRRLIDPGEIDRLNDGSIHTYS